MKKYLYIYTMAVMVTATVITAAAVAAQPYVKDIANTSASILDMTHEALVNVRVRSCYMLEETDQTPFIIEECVAAVKKGEVF